LLTKGYNINMDYQNSKSFHISQRFTPIVNRFDIYDSENKLIGFAEQKRFNLREKITVWKSDAKDEVLFFINAEKIFDIHGKYLVLDGSSQVVGYLRKAFLNSLIRSTWEAYDPKDNLLYKARERNIVIAVIRRVGGFIPVLGELLEQLPFNFDLIKENKIIGHHRRKIGIRDNYEIQVNDEVAETDKRILLALGLLLDILQNR
jgi:uncharacterized protein YxjI